VIFVDTSAFYAVLDRDDTAHRRARIVWGKLLTDGVDLYSSNYGTMEPMGSGTMEPWNHGTNGTRLIRQ